MDGAVTPKQGGVVEASALAADGSGSGAGIVTRTVVEGKKRVSIQTFNPDRASDRSIAMGAIMYPEPVVRPKTRAECLQGHGAIRPCPYFGCKHHLGSDDANTPGSVTFWHAEGVACGGSDIDPTEALESMPETCALDVADAGAHTLEDVGALLNITRERVRQIEEIAFAKLRDAGVIIPTDYIERDYRPARFERCDDDDNHDAPAARTITTTREPKPLPVWAAPAQHRHLPVVTEVPKGGTFWCGEMNAAVTTHLCEKRHLARYPSGRKVPVFTQCASCGHGAANLARLGKHAPTATVSPVSRTVAPSTTTAPRVPDAAQPPSPVARQRPAKAAKVKAAPTPRVKAPRQPKPARHTQPAQPTKPARVLGLCILGCGEREMPVRGEASCYRGLCKGDRRRAWDAVARGHATPETVIAYLASGGAEGIRKAQRATEATQPAPTTTAKNRGGRAPQKCRGAECDATAAPIRDARGKHVTLALHGFCAECRADVHRVASERRMTLTLAAAVVRGDEGSMAASTLDDVCAVEGCDGERAPILPTTLATHRGLCVACRRLAQMRCGRSTDTAVVLAYLAATLRLRASGRKRLGFGAFVEMRSST